MTIVSLFLQLDNSHLDRVLIECLLEQTEDPVLHTGHDILLVRTLGLEGTHYVVHGRVLPEARTLEGSLGGMARDQRTGGDEPKQTQTKNYFEHF